MTRRRGNASPLASCWNGVVCSDDVFKLAVHGIELVLTCLGSLIHISAMPCASRRKMSKKGLNLKTMDARLLSCLRCRTKAFELVILSIREDIHTNIERSVDRSRYYNAIVLFVMVLSPLQVSGNTSCGREWSLSICPHEVHLLVPLRPEDYSATKSLLVNMG